MKYTVMDAHPILALILRFGISIIILIPFLKKEKVNLKWLILTSITMTGSILFLNFAVMYTQNLPLIIIIFQLNVVMTSILSILLLGEYMNKIRILGTVLAFIGIVIVIFAPGDEDSLTGIIFTLIAAFSNALFNIFNKKLHAKNILSTLCITNIIAMPILLICSIFLIDLSFDSIKNISWQGWGGLFFSGIISTGVGYNVWFYLNKKYPLSLISPFGLFIPIFGTLGSVIFFQDTILESNFFIGSAIALIGIAIVSIYRSKEEKFHPLLTYRSPNFDDRNDNISVIVLHFTEINFHDSVGRLCSPPCKVSSHYLIAKSGDIYKLVDEKFRAWHAGESYWHKPKVNNFSIGIEIENDGHEPYPKEQIESVIHLCHKLIKKYNITPLNIIGHSDIAPTRKVDPGTHFPWQHLADNSIGLMPKKINLETDESEDTLKELLTILGYNPKWPIEDNIKAFRNHYLNNIDKVSISSIIGAIKNLLEQNK